MKHDLVSETQQIASDFLFNSSLSPKAIPEYINPLPVLNATQKAARDDYSPFQNEHPSSMLCTTPEINSKLLIRFVTVARASTLSPHDLPPLARL